MTARLTPRATGAALDKLTAHPDSAERVEIQLTDADLAAYRAAQEGVTRATAPGPWADVTDQATGHPIRIRATSCGLRCVCDAEVQMIERAAR